MLLDLRSETFGSGNGAEGNSLLLRSDRQSNERNQTSCSGREQSLGSCGTDRGG